MDLLLYLSEDGDKLGGVLLKDVAMVKGDNRLLTSAFSCSTNELVNGLSYFRKYNISR